MLHFAVKRYRSFHFVQMLTRLRKAKNTGNLLSYFAYAFPDRPCLIHAGAHIGQERDFYSRLGFEERIWLEPVPKFLNELNKNVAPDIALPFALWSSNTTLNFHISADEVSSSVFEFSELNPFHGMKMVEEIQVKGRSLDSLLLNELSNILGDYILVLDTQGSELECLKGISEVNFEKIIACIVETSKIPLYDKSPLRYEVIKKLHQSDFKLAMTLSRPPTFHGDELFIRRDYLKRHKINSKKLFLLRIITKYSEIKFRLLTRLLRLP